LSFIQTENHAMRHTPCYWLKRNVRKARAGQIVCWIRFNSGRKLTEKSRVWKARENPAVL